MSLVRSLNDIIRRVPAWPIYIIAVGPPVWLFYLGLTGGLGVEPIEALEHEMGELGLQVLIAVLVISPLRTVAGVNLVKYRRALGLVGFFYILAHLAVWLFLDVGIWSQIWADIVKRPYITIGMAAFVMMIPLAVTSNNLAVRKLGLLAWRRLHRVTYAAIVLGAVHFVMLTKVWQLEPLIYLAAILGLLAFRLQRQWDRKARKAPA